ncbi:unnamed protein product [Hydatigera taeniaeformis]|uniref:DNA replication complex GINS protein PSF3 n=1 Tax=Hydatigena taeniaeformis TaxID=6205 RepID=A0A0R3X4L2_HYDTA|nr:unnamed protein product [Hydatigera taeniaeformis]
MQIDLRGFLTFEWTLSLAYHGSYLNIDDILSTSNRLLCKTRISLPRIAPLLIGPIHTYKRPQSSTEGAIHDNDVSSGTRLEVPLWLISSIGSSRRQIFLIEIPVIYRHIRRLILIVLDILKGGFWFQEIYREIFAADPWVVDLRKRCPNFYSFGCHLSSLSLPGMPAVIATLENVFQRRIRNLMEASLNANKVSVMGLISRLEELEQALFRIGRNGRCSIDRWFSRMHERLEASTLAKATEAATEASLLPSKRSRKT